MLLPAAIDPALLAFSLAVLLIALGSVYLAMRKSRAWLILTAILLGLGVPNVVSAVTESTKTERLTIENVYYTNELNCRAERGAAPPDCGSYNTNTILENHIATNHGTFDSPPAYIYNGVQVGHTYTCQVKTYQGIAAPILKSCTL